MMNAAATEVPRVVSSMRVASHSTERVDAYEAYTRGRIDGLGDTLDAIARGSRHALLLSAIRLRAQRAPESELRSYLLEITEVVK